jgi:hypothetical protein
MSLLMTEENCFCTLNKHSSLWVVANLQHCSCERNTSVILLYWQQVDNTVVVDLHETAKKYVYGQVIVNTS